jgi:hypothetical protein
MSVRNYTLFVSDLFETGIFSADFQNALEYQISLKAVRWGGAELLPENEF